jgi:hypothetical protein
LNTSARTQLPPISICFALLSLLLPPCLVGSLRLSGEMVAERLVHRRLQRCSRGRDRVDEVLVNEDAVRWRRRWFAAEKAAEQRHPQQVYAGVIVRTLAAAARYRSRHGRDIHSPAHTIAARRSRGERLDGRHRSHRAVEARRKGADGMDG